MEYVNIYSVQSSVRLLEALKGKMLRVGTDLSAKKSVDYLSTKDARKLSVLVVLGNEEHGISDAVRKNCDELVIIPWGGMKDGAAESVVDSLNVAQAASVIFYEMMK